jgi:uncharacterized membrane protein
MQDLSVLAGGGYSVADALCADGSTVGGSSGSPNGAAAFLWTSGTGMLNLNNLLPMLGIDLTGWRLTSVGSMSSDGTSLTGHGVYNGQGRAWVVTGIPSPSVLAIAVGFVSIACRRRRKP